MIKKFAIITEIYELVADEPQAESLQEDKIEYGRVLIDGYTGIKDMWTLEEFNRRLNGRRLLLTDTVAKPLHSPGLENFIEYTFTDNQLVECITTEDSDIEVVKYYYIVDDLSCKKDIDIKFTNMSIEIEKYARERKVTLADIKYNDIFNKESILVSTVECKRLYKATKDSIEFLLRDNSYCVVYSRAGIDEVLAKRWEIRKEVTKK